MIFNETTIIILGGKDKSSDSFNIFEKAIARRGV